MTEPGHLDTEDVLVKDVGDRHWLGVVGLGGGGGVTGPNRDRARPPGHRGRPCQRRGGVGTDWGWWG